MDYCPTRDAVLTDYASSLIKYKARQLTRRSGFSRSDEEDIAQDLTLTLLAKAYLYDANRACQNTFVDRVVRSAIAIILRDRRRLKRAAGFTAQSLDQPPSGDADTTPLRDSLPASGPGGPKTVEQSDFVAAVVNVVESLPPDLQEISRRLKTDAVSAVARDMGISRRQIRNAIERIRKHFESKGLSDF